MRSVDSHSFFVRGINGKDASIARYGDLLVRDEEKDIPECIRHLISEKFYDDTY